MAHFIITYDLRAPGRNYTALLDALRGANAVKIAESVWLGEFVTTAEATRNILRGLMDANDRLVVIELKKGSLWAAQNGMAPGVDWLKTHIHP